MFDNANVNLRYEISVTHETGLKSQIKSCFCLATFNPKYFKSQKKKVQGRKGRINQGEYDERNIFSFYSNRSITKA